jgi:Ser/Thr protein kinase RdoA (MazF antagonist)
VKTIPPSVQDVVAIAEGTLSARVVSVRRFLTGLHHHVYEVLTEPLGPVVVRIAQPQSREYLTGAVYWSQLLRSRGVPLPALLAFDLQSERSPFPFLILERLPGTDLAHVYEQLSAAEKEALAREIVQVQHRVGSLPPGTGFGFSFGPNTESMLPTWRAFLDTLLERSRRRIKQMGLVDSRHVDRVGAHLDALERYFDGIGATAFLDDVTVKNVLIDAGKLSGIVDVDVVCYGDSLLTLGLTRMALLARGWDLDYLDFWCEELDLTSQQRHALHLYTALYCVDFLSEVGQEFNTNRAVGKEPEHVRNLLQILEALLALL